MSIQLKIFENIISENELINLDEKQLIDFYFEKEILIYINDDVPKYVSTFFNSANRFDIPNKIKNNLIRNTKIIDEILLNFFEYLSLSHDDCNGLKKHLEYKLTFVLSEKEKIKILKKNYKKYRKKLLKNAVYRQYVIPYSTELDSDFIISLLKMEIKTNNNLFFNYITMESSIDFFDSPTLGSYKEAIEYTRLINYIKEQLENLTNEQIILEQKSPNKSLTLNQSLILLDELRCMEDDKWLNLEKTKKARLISALLNKDYSNTIKGLALLEKKKSEVPSQFLKDTDHVKTLIKDTLHNT